MAIGRPPAVGSWYVRADRPQPFQVVAVDARGGTVDIEYFDGTVDEWPLSHWHGLEIEACEAPRDFSGAYDDIEWDERPNGEPGLSRDEAVRELLEGPVLREIPPARLRGPARGRRAAGARRGKHR